MGALFKSPSVAAAKPAPISAAMADSAAQSELASRRRRRSALSTVLSERDQPAAGIIAKKATGE